MKRRNKAVNNSSKLLQINWTKTSEQSQINNTEKATTEKKKSNVLFSSSLCDPIRKPHCSATRYSEASREFASERTQIHTQTKIAAQIHDKFLHPTGQCIGRRKYAENESTSITIFISGFIFFHWKTRLKTICTLSTEHGCSRYFVFFFASYRLFDSIRRTIWNSISIICT